MNLEDYEKWRYKMSAQDKLYNDIFESVIKTGVEFRHMCETEQEARYYVSKFVRINKHPDLIFDLQEKIFIIALKKLSAEDARLAKSFAIRNKAIANSKL